jgi:type II secretory pathway pseudopilin PulG
MQANEQGYVLLTLLLFMALLVVAAATAAPNIAFEIKRDREEELVHRGVEYTRAIQRFAKANARYPLRLEELQSTGGMKYIRKLYKDPVTGGDFRLLYMSDVRVATNTRVAGDPGFVGNSNAAAASGLAPAAAAVTSGNDTAPENASGDAAPGATSVPTTAPGSAPSATNSSAGGSIGGGGAIVGVVSKSTKRSVREFNKKNHYNDWLFFYLPNYTGAQRIKGPTSLTPPAPASLNASANQNQPPVVQDSTTSVQK